MGVLYSLQLACRNWLNFTKREQIKRLKCKLFPQLAVLQSVLTMKKNPAMSALVHGGNSEPKQTFHAHVYLTYVFVCI